MSIKNNHLIVLSVVAATSFILTTGFCAEPKQGVPVTPSKNTEPVYAGEFLDTKVPVQNYIFMQNAVSVFNNRMGPVPKGAKEKEDYIWDLLLLSYEAFRKEIVVTEDEVDREISSILAEYKVDFNRKTDKAAFAKWVKEKTGEPVELFENQIRQLLQIEKMRQQLIDGIKPPVTEAEAHQAFLDEYNSLSIELTQFAAKKDADDFYQKLKNSLKFWDEQKTKSPDNFKQPGFVSLVFLMDIWKLPREAAYNMIKMKEGEFYPTASVYNGYAVFKILKTRPASEQDYAKVKNTYFDKVKKRKQYEGYNDWFKNFREQAKIKIYPTERLNKKEGGQQK